MSKWTFNDALHKFQYDVVEEWQDKLRKGQRIAISIQLREEIQDRARACASPRRSASGAPEAVNVYCQQVLDKQWTTTQATADCDQLDDCLKRRHEWREQNPHLEFAGRFSCRCHGGVSNILIPFRYGDSDDDDLWYVFFGQFLLKAENAEIQDLLMVEHRIEPITDISQTERGHLQENVFVDEALHASHFKGEISLVSLPDFFAFKNFALRKFDSFLRDVYSDAAKLRSLKHYKDHINSAALLIKCDQLKKDVNGKTSLELPERQKLLQKISRVEHDARMLDDEEATKILIQWAQQGLDGDILNEEWRNQRL
jgi:hypothetical protein